jgi:hypothetical protein
VKFNPKQKKTSCTFWIAFLCLIALFIVTSIQATHICPVQQAKFPVKGNATAVSSEVAPCLICMMAQLVAPSLLFVEFSLSLRATKGLGFSRLQPKQFLQFSHLYDRPPPLLNILRPL